MTTTLTWDGIITCLTRDAARRGDTAWAAALHEDVPGQWKWSWTSNTDVVAKVTYSSAISGTESQLAPLVDVWRLHDAGLHIESLRAPRPCLIYIAATLWSDQSATDARFGYLIDATGCAGAANSRHPVAGTTLGALVQRSATKGMYGMDRRKQRNAAKGMAHGDAAVLFASAFAEHVLADLTENRIGASTVPVDYALWIGSPATTRPFAQSHQVENDHASPSALGSHIVGTFNRERYNVAVPGRDFGPNNVANWTALTESCEPAGPADWNKEAGWGGQAPDDALRTKEGRWEAIVRSDQVDPTGSWAVRNADIDQMATDVRSTLTERQIEAARLVYGQGMTEREAADVMGLARATVATHLRNAKKKLAGHKHFGKLCP